MTKKRKVALVTSSLIIGLAIVGYVVIPAIAQQVIRNEAENKGYEIGEIELSWAGPQLVSDLHVEHAYGSADLTLGIRNSLFGLLLGTKPIDAHGSGTATLTFTTNDFDTQRTNTKKNADRNSNPSNQKKGSSAIFSKLLLTLSLDTLTIETEDVLRYTNVETTLDVDPGHHFLATLSAQTMRGGSIEATCKSPTLVTNSGAINPEGSGTLTVRIDNAALPAWNGVRGWVIDTCSGAISSPNISKSLNVGVNGSLTEFDQERGTVFCKTQLVKSDTQDLFTVGDWAVIGSVHVSDVPTTILTPFLDTLKIHTTRDIGPTMSAKLSRGDSETTPIASFISKHLTISASVDSEDGALTDVELTANIHNDLLQTYSEGTLSGNPTLDVRLDQLALVGVSENSIVGSLGLHGLVQYGESTVIESISADVRADVLHGNFSLEGEAMINETKSSFHTSLHSLDKLDGLDDLWKTTIGTLPYGEGDISFQNVPSTLLVGCIPNEHVNPTRDFGDTFSIDLSLRGQSADCHFRSKNVRGSCVAKIQEGEISSFEQVEVLASVQQSLASSLLNTKIDSVATVDFSAQSIDTRGNASFETNVHIGNQHTFIRGVTSRSATDNLNAHLSITGLDTRLVDAMCSTNGLLVDTIGTPISTEIIANDVFNKPVVRLGGTAPKAAFESSLTFFDGKLYTNEDSPTNVDLRLSQGLTRHLLKDLGPVLSDIRTIKKPIRFNASGVQVSLAGDVSELQADVSIDIGEVELDSGSITMQLLPMFNSTHREVVSGYFEPIQIQIRDGIATYKKFNLVLDNKYTIPYSGSINFVTNALNIQTAVPLTGLGYSIKELRGLATDIDVPILITGTIDTPNTRVDPDFDLVELLMNNGIHNFINNTFGGDDEAPNPLDLIEELLQ